jgi:opacity protein-like surface antigen
MRKAFIISFLFVCHAVASYSQADKLMDMLDDDNATDKKEAVTSTFKATRIVNSSTVENLAKGVLDFRILHRFGRVSDGFDNAFGFDNATTRIGLDYGITNWLMVGIGHNTLYKANDGLVKIKLLGQKTNGTPITLSYFGGMSVNGGKAPALPPGMDYYFSHRIAYANQLLIARKFSSKFSLQLMPTLIHQNLVDSTRYSNSTFALGAGARLKVSKRIAITGEYYYRLNNADMLSSGSTTYNSLSIGCDIETGGHVFQLFFSNSSGMTERTFITQSTDTWEKGQLHFGFNISRVFTVVKPKEFRGKEGSKW